MNATPRPEPERPRVSISEILSAFALESTRPETDKAMKLQIAGRFVEFMASKGLDKIALCDLNAHHVSEWLGNDELTF